MCAARSAFAHAAGTKYCSHRSPVCTAPFLNQRGPTIKQIQLTELHTSSAYQAARLAQRCSCHALHGCHNSFVLLFTRATVSTALVQQLGQLPATVGVLPAWVLAKFWEVNGTASRSWCAEPAGCSLSVLHVAATFEKPEPFVVWVGCSDASDQSGR